MRRKRWVGAIAVASTCALVGAAGGIASSGAATTTSKATTAKTAKSGGGGRHDMDGGPSIHSVSVQLNKAGTAFITVTRDEGTVTAVSGSDITLHEGTKTVSYKDVTVTVPDGATVTRNDATATLAEVKVGDRVSISSSSEATEVRADDPTFMPAMGGRGGPDGGGHGGPPPANDSSTASGG
jgi:hypothetical protein